MTGKKYDEGKTIWSAVPTLATKEMADIMSFGATKYGKFNYLGGLEYLRLWDAAIRHLWAWVTGEDTDKESGKSHLAHAACCCLMILELQLRKLGQDDRYGKTDLLHRRGPDSGGHRRKSTAWCSTALERALLALRLSSLVKKRRVRGKKVTYLVGDDTLLSGHNRKAVHSNRRQPKHNTKRNTARRGRLERILD